MSGNYINRQDVLNDIADLFTICHETLPNECGHHFVTETELNEHYEYVKNLPIVNIAAPRWVRCEDAMPDLLQFVVACNDEGKCVFAQYVGYQTDSLTPWRIAYTMYDTDIYDDKECGPVRYWMPIEPPKEDMDGERREG